MPPCGPRSPTERGIATSALSEPRRWEADGLRWRGPRRALRDKLWRVQNSIAIMQSRPAVLQVTIQTAISLRALATGWSRSEASICNQIILHCCGLTGDGHVRARSNPGVRLQPIAADLQRGGPTPTSTGQRTSATSMPIQRLDHGSFLVCPANVSPEQVSLRTVARSCANAARLGAVSRRIVDL